jgi:hypothetical protein
MICLGILGALCINVVLPVTDWRLMFKVAAIPAAVLFLGEAPAFLHQQWQWQRPFEAPGAATAAAMLRTVAVATTARASTPFATSLQLCMPSTSRWLTWQAGSMSVEQCHTAC